jgi:hypothetical protein
LQLAIPRTKTNVMRCAADKNMFDATVDGRVVGCAVNILNTIVLFRMVGFAVDVLSAARKNNRLIGDATLLAC